MRTVGEWLDEYGLSHRNALNERLHFICVPAIVLSVIGLLSALPTPGAWSAHPWLNWATLATLGALTYYLALSWPLAAGAGVVFVLMFAVVRALATLAVPLWASSLAIFVIAWIGQFIGHHAEGRRPSFFQDVQFLLIGPIWLLAAAYRRLGLKY